MNVNPHRRYRHPFVLLPVLAAFIASVFSPFAVSVEAASGDIDPTFGISGKVTVGILNTTFPEPPHAIAIQKDGKMVVAGANFNFPPPSPRAKIVVVRLNPDGSLDATFGTGGVVMTGFSSQDDIANALAIQDDGKILVGGYSVGSLDKPRFVVLRLNADGSPDVSFGYNGLWMVGIGAASVEALAIQPDGKIIAAGSANFPIRGWRGQFIVRLNPNGTLDMTFGGYGYGAEFGQGVVLNPSAALGGARAIALQPDGKIITSDGISLARYNPDGSLDATFGSGGITATSVTVSSLNALALQSDGRILVAGGSPDFVVARYKSNGAPDKSFNGNGRVNTDFFGEDDAARALIIQPDGRLVAIGYASHQGNLDFALARYNGNGSLDLTFGTDGKVTTDFDGGNDVATAAALQSDGKIVAFGNTRITSFRGALARYSGAGFDLTLQDESNGNILQINSATGQYVFKNCAGTVLGGTGTITRRGAIIALQHNGGDRKVQATVDGNTHRANATIKIIGGGPAYTIIDRDVTDDTGTCP
ncbi:MAG TPA: hypothetical protein VKA60_19845 [Blastocatellia bacterium]|nr:hypothetical protein [Blastocatellia bacterium]